MKTSDLSIKELAAFIGVSTDTIRRAARKGEIPVTHVGTAYRFDLRQVRQTMERNGQSRVQRRNRNREEALRDRRHMSAARTAKTPPIGKTGACIAEE